jgi:hypothetical protein
MRNKSNFSGRKQFVRVLRKCRAKIHADPLISSTFLHPSSMHKVPKKFNRNGKEIKMGSHVSLFI